MLFDPRVTHRPARPKVMGIARKSALHPSYDSLIWPGVAAEVALTRRHVAVVTTISRISLAVPSVRPRSVRCGPGLQARLWPSSALNVR